MKTKVIIILGLAVLGLAAVGSLISQDILYVALFLGMMLMHLFGHGGHGGHGDSGEAGKDDEKNQHGGH